MFNIMDVLKSTPFADRMNNIMYIANIIFLNKSNMNKSWSLGNVVMIFCYVYFSDYSKRHSIL